MNANDFLLLAGAEATASWRSRRSPELTSPGIVCYCICVSNRERAEVLQGTLDIMVLQTLAALGPSHGYAMAARIEQVSGGRVQLNMGTLYPGLMRLEQRGFVRGTWGVTESNRKARFYALTPAGKKQLAAEKREWNRIVTTMQAILNEPS
jgi:PadR family transcriptional regulator PadR